MFQVYNMKTDDILDNFEPIVLTDILKRKWDELHQKTGIFRYKIDTLKERIVDDNYMIQLNINRGTKRRMPESIQHMNQPFDDAKFNFTKVSDQEIMFTLIKDNDKSNIHIILVNVSPINRFHSLLCPSVYKKLPQVATLESLKLALEIMLLSKDRSLKIGFNSLCALASVNHLHYHLLFENRTLPVEDAICTHVQGSLYVLKDYVVPAFCYYADKNVDKAGQDIFKLLQFLMKKCIAHNILMTLGKELKDQDIIKVFVWPRKSCAGVKNLAAFNVAICELAGWFPVYDAVEFANIQSEDLEKELKKWKYDEFHKLCEEVKSLF